MNAPDKREFQPSAGLEGMVNPPNDSAPPHPAERFPAVTPHEINTTNSGDGATAGEAQPITGSLSEAQLVTFWAGIVANLDAARRMARLFVSRKDGDDVVNTAAIQFIESLQRPEKPASFPKTEDELRGRFLAVVRNHALDCVRESDIPECPVHSHWGMPQEPGVGGRKVADRNLDHVFARNDSNQYDAEAPAERCDQDTSHQLERFLRRLVSKLPRMQHRVIEETFFEGRKRAEVARLLGICVKTYDSHLQAAFRSLRHLLMQEAEASTGAERLFLLDLIDELRERCAATPLSSAFGKKGERSTPEGKRSNTVGKRGKPDGSAAA